MNEHELQGRYRLGDEKCKWTDHGARGSYDLRDAISPSSRRKCLAALACIDRQYELQGRSRLGNEKCTWAEHAARGPYRMREAAKREFAPVVVFVGPARPAVSHIGGPSLFVVSNDLKFGHPVTATISARYLWALSKNSKRMRHDLSILGTGFLGLSDLGHFPKKANECDTTCLFWAPAFWATHILGTFQKKQTNATRLVHFGHGGFWATQIWAPASGPQICAPARDKRQ